jgi:hypothetical protein
MSKAVQLRGKNQVVKAFTNIGEKAWAIDYGRQQLHKCVGTDPQDAAAQLDDVLKIFQEANSQTSYTLRIFCEIDNVSKIKPSTEPDYSYNLTLFNDDDERSPAMNRRDYYLEKMIDRLDQLEAKIAVREEEDVGEQEGVGDLPLTPAQTLINHLNKILDLPAVQNKIGEITCGFFDKLFKPGPMNKATAGAIGSTPDQPITDISQADIEKINNAVQILAHIDPNLGDNLTMLATIAQNNPKKYQSLAGMLKTFA